MCQAEKNADRLRSNKAFGLAQEFCLNNFEVSLESLFELSQDSICVDPRTRSMEF